MKLTEAQHLFTICQAKFVIWAAGRGYRLVGSEWWRTPEQAALYADQGKGIKNSVHRKKLAIDFLLFDENWQLVHDAEKYEELGRYWKTLHPLARWGGDFKGRDAVHFSFEWKGVK